MTWTGRKSPTRETTKDSCNETLLVHGPSVGRYNLNSCLIPVENQCAGISSISTVATTLFRNSSFSLLKSAFECLLLAVVAFLFTNFMRLKSNYAQCLFSSIWPSNSTKLDWSQDSRMPLAAAIAILAETTPPLSLTILRYI